MMSQSNKDKAKVAGDCLREAHKRTKEAKEIFEIIGDPDGIRKSAAVEKPLREARKYVDSKVGDKS